MKNQVQLITYVDRLCGDLKRLKVMFQGPFRGLLAECISCLFFTRSTAQTQDSTPLITHRLIHGLATGMMCIH